MKVFAIRQQSLTKKGPERGMGSPLSGAGGQLARRIGETIGPCDLVLSSPSPRTIETALATGYTVDGCLNALGELPEAFVEEIGHRERWAWEDPFQVLAQVLAQVVAQGRAAAQMGHRIRAAWRTSADAVPDQEKVPLTTYGRLLEVGVVACLSAAYMAAWGRPFGDCEGIQLGDEAGNFHLLDLLRLESANHTRQAGSWGNTFSEQLGPRLPQALHDARGVVVVQGRLLEVCKHLRPLRRLRQVARVA